MSTMDRRSGQERRTAERFKLTLDVQWESMTGCEYKIVSDRRDAILAAVAKARANDVVIIAGKGHETYQIIGKDKFHFDDREIALEALEKIRED